MPKTKKRTNVSKSKDDRTPYGIGVDQSVDGTPPTEPGDNVLNPEIRKSAPDKVNPRSGVDNK